MNPIEIKIKVGLEDNTLEILTALMTAAVRTGGNTKSDPLQNVKNAVAVAEKAAEKAEAALNEAEKHLNEADKAMTEAEQESAEIEQKRAEIAQKQAEIEQKPAEVATDSTPVEEDLPEISDTELRAIVTETRQRVGSAATIRAMMAEKFGIKVSTECPQERRPEFINALKEL